MARFSPTRKTPRRIPVLILLALSLSACTYVADFPDIQKLPAEELASFRDYSGLRIGTFTYLDADRTKDTFGAELHGTLPVHVVLENHTSDTFLLKTRNFSLVELDGSLESPATAPLTGASRATEAMETSGAVLVGAASVADLVTTIVAPGALIAPIAGLVIVPILPIGVHLERAKAKKEQIRHRLIEAELADQTLHPDELRQGVVFFPFSAPRDSAQVADMGVRIELENLSKQASRVIVVPLQAREEH